MRISPQPGKGAMADTFSSKLQLWDGRQASPAQPALAAPQPLLGGLNHPNQLHAAESLGPRSCRPPDTIEPFSLQWFLDVEHQRHQRHARWLPSALEFDKHSGETLLGLGTGLGTDWV